MPELIHSFGHTFFRIEFQRIVLYYTFLIYFRRKEDIAINDDAINHIRSSYVCVFHESLPKFLNYRLQAIHADGHLPKISRHIQRVLPNHGQWRVVDAACYPLLNQQINHTRHLYSSLVPIMSTYELCV